MINFPPVDHSVYAIYPCEVKETAWRRQLQVELAQIQEEIKRFGTQDEMSQLIDQWYQNFKHALRLPNCQSDEVLHSFIVLMQSILRDPINHTPLDKGPRLGNDGKTYGSLFLHLYSTDEQNPKRDKSPFYPNSDIAFKTSPHYLAYYMNQVWLKKHQACLYTDEMEKQDLKLIQARKNSLSINHSDQSSSHSFIGRVKFIQNMQNEQKNELQIFQNQLGELQDQFKEWTSQDLKMITNTAQELKQKFIKEIVDIRQIDKKEMTILANREEALSKEIVQLDHCIQTLKSNIQIVEHDVDNAKKDARHLQVLTDEVKILIKKRENSWVKDLQSVALVVGSCALSAWMLQGPTISGSIITTSKGAVAKFGFAL